MKKHNLFSINEFTELSRTTRDRLHHYDKIGLLAPKVRGENRYRYYSIGQIAHLNVIRTLLELGMSLAEIRDFLEHRTPDRTNQILENQVKTIDEKMATWSKAKKLLQVYRQSISSVSGVDEHAITIQSLPEEKIVLGGLNDYSQGGTEYDALCAFYRAVSASYPEFDLNYPVWGFFAEERIKQGIWMWPDRYYFFNPEGRDARPAGQYAVGYTRGGYGQGAETFKRLTAYMDKNGLEICGNAYKEYPLNEICIANDKDYLIRVMVAVRKKK